MLQNYATKVNFFYFYLLESMYVAQTWKYTNYCLKMFFLPHHRKLLHFYCYFACILNKKNEYFFIFYSLFDFYY